MALHLAAANGAIEEVKAALESRADVGQVDPNGAPPLLLAAAGGHLDAVEVLLQAAADPQQRTDNRAGEFPLLLAAQQGHTPVVSALLQSCAPAWQCSLDRRYSLLESAKYGREACIKLLLEHRAADQLNRWTGRRGNSPLLLAAQGGHPSSVAALLDARAMPGKINEQDGRFPLLAAADKGREACVITLLEGRADPRQVNSKTGYTALHHAAGQGHDACLQHLLNARGLPRSPTSAASAASGQTAPTPSMLASYGGSRGHTACLDLLAAEEGSGAAEAVQLRREVAELHQEMATLRQEVQQGTAACRREDSDSSWTQAEAAPATEATGRQQKDEQSI